MLCKWKLAQQEERSMLWDLLHAGECIHEDILPLASWTWHGPSNVQWPSFTIIWRKTEFPGRDGVILHWWGPNNGGTVNGLRTFVTQWGPSTIWNHCMNHCEQLASSELSVPIIDILQQVITMGNYIKPRPLPAQSQLSLWLAENWPSYICNRHFRKTKQTQAWEEPEYYSDKPSYWWIQEETSERKPLEGKRHAFPRMSQFLKQHP